MCVCVCARVWPISIGFTLTKSLFQCRNRGRVCHSQHLELERGRMDWQRRRGGGGRENEKHVEKREPERGRSDEAEREERYRRELCSSAVYWKSRPARPAFTELWHENQNARAHTLIHTHTHAAAPVHHITAHTCVRGRGWGGGTHNTSGIWAVRSICPSSFSS